MFTYKNSQFSQIIQIPYNLFYLLPQLKTIRTTPNGLIYLIYNKTFIKKP